MLRQQLAHRPAQRALQVRAILEARRKRYPLAYARLWDNPEPKTSQRRALLPLLDPNTLVLSVLGGNRSGKSALMADWLVANALGRDYCIDGPEGRVYVVKRWLELNGLPEHLIPKGPGECWVASPNFGAACGQIRPHIRKLAPEGTRFVRWDQPAEAAVVFPPSANAAPGSPGGVIISKAYKQYDQDPQTWEGANVRCIGLDEQPNSLACLLAALSRCVDQQGKIVIALTPLRGKNDWFYKEVASPSAQAANPEYRIVHLFGEDNPHIPQEYRERIMRKFPAWQRAARERGEFVSPEGAVYPITWEQHVVEPFVPPKEWNRFTGVDWGARSPHVVWVAQVKTAFTAPTGMRFERGDLVCYREFAPRAGDKDPRFTSERVVAEALKLEQGTYEGLRQAPIYRVADSADPDAIEQAAELGFNAEPARKGAGSIARGINLVEALLQTVDPLTVDEKTGEPASVRPRLYFMKTCPVLIEEMMGLRWAETSDTNEQVPDEACPDHGPDALRYIVQYMEDHGWAQAA